MSEIERVLSGAATKAAMDDDLREAPAAFLVFVKPDGRVGYGSFGATAQLVLAAQMAVEDFRDEFMSAAMGIEGEDSEGEDGEE